MRSKSTMVELVDELKKLPRSAEIDFMIKEALDGEFHDYKNSKYICGKVESATRLDRLGFHDLASRIKDGEFDEDADEEDKQNIRDILGMNGPEFRKIFEYRLLVEIAKRLPQKKNDK